MNSRFAQVTILALAYYLTGRLGLLLAVPPGYETAVWPPAGIALAGVLLLGVRAWPGVLIGAFCANLLNRSDTTSIAGIFTSLSTAGLIATGACLQALTGAWLCRRYIRFPNPFETVRDIALLLVLGGPLACLVSSSIGPTVLTLFGALPLANFMVVWATWWSGDAIGVMVFTPILLLVFDRTLQISTRRKRTVAFVLISTFFMAILLFIAARSWEGDRQRLAFQKDAAVLTSELSDRVSNDIDAIATVGLLFDSTNSVGRNEFDNFANSVLRRHPGIKGLTWVVKVEAKERLSFETQQSASSYMNFSITERDANLQIRPAATRAAYYPITYQVPVVPDLYGFDIYSDGIRHATMDVARDNSQLRATPRLSLVKIDTDDYALSILQPVFRRGAPTATIEQRRHNIQGFVSGALIIPDLIRASLGTLQDREISFFITDDDSTTDSRLLYDSRTPDHKEASTRAPAHSNEPRWQKTITVAGRHWTVHCVQSQEVLLALQNWAVWFALAGGLLFTALMGAFATLTTARADTVRRLVAERTQQVSESEAFLERAGAVSGVGGFKIDLRTGEQTWTRQTYQIHDLDEHIPPTLGAVDRMVDPAIRKELQGALQRAKDEGEGYDIEFPLTTARGRSVWVRTVGVVEFDHGRPLSVIGAIQDITERKLAQEQLRQTSERFRMAADGAGIGIFEWNIPEKFIYWDDQMYRLYDCQRSDVEDPLRYWSNHMHPDDRQGAERALERALTGEAPFDTEFRIVHRNGEVRYLKATGRVQHGADGKPLRMAGTNFDITERRHLEDSIRASEATFRLAMQHAAIGMALVRPDGRWLKVNRALCELVGYTEEELIAADFQAITHPDDLQADLDYVAKLLQGSLQTYQIEKRYLHKDGRVIWACLSVSLVHNADGSPQYFVSQIQDISARRQMDRMKSEFIATVSHELRTPLTSIRGSLGLINGGAAGVVPDSMARMIAVAYHNTGRLTQLINDILDVEKIESGKLSLYIECHSLASLLEQAVEENRGYALAHQVSFETQMPLPDVSVNIDPTRFMQVLANLLSNAAKFSPANTVVEISVELRNTEVRVLVKDNGPGITTDFQPLMFQRFSQADGSDSRAKSGTGLGLAIVKALVEQMGGRVGYKTRVGQGTTVFFDLPVAVRVPSSAVEIS